MAGSPEVVRRSPGDLGRTHRREAAGWPLVVGVRLLLVDPDPGEELVPRLEEVGAHVTWSRNGADALVSYGSTTPDAVLIAPTLPDLAAPDVVRAMRRFGDQPILLGVGPDDAELAGPILVAGATGAVSRPYDAGELTHRLAGELPDLVHRGRLTFGPVELDAAAHTVRVGGRELPAMPLKEFELLRLLLRYADQVVSAEAIRAVLWPDVETAPTTNALAVHVARLRSRLPGPARLLTVRGLGYRLTLDESSDPLGD